MLAALATRHEILRTSFPASDGVAVQRIAPPAPEDVPLGMTDLSALPSQQRDTRLCALIDEEAARPFDLAQDPPWRVQLLRLGDAQHVLLFTMHHIASDGWSMDVLQRDFALLFNARFNSGFRGLCLNHSQSIFSFQPQIEGLRFQTRWPRIAEKV